MMESKKYRKKPVTIDAVQYSGDWVQLHDVDWTEKALGNETLVPVRHSDGSIVIHIKTKEGTLMVKPGEYIVKGVRGELCPVDQNIFEQTYTGVTDEAEYIYVVERHDRHGDGEGEAVTASNTLEGAQAYCERNHAQPVARGEGGNVWSYASTMDDYVIRKLEVYREDADI